MFKKNSSLHVITGPCVIESEEHTLFCAERLVRMFEDKPCQLIFKASYDKANRTSYHSFRGPGIDKGLKILQKVRKMFNIPVTADIHHPEEAEKAAEVLDILQIPAFLCRQTDLITAAAATGKWVNVKKGQFLSPGDMRHVIEKIEAAGGDHILLTERGTTFGYGDLVIDFRSFPKMRAFGRPVCCDLSHGVQKPGGEGDHSGGESMFIPHLARAAVAIGVDALFIESHPEPAKALSDRKSVLSFFQLEALLREVLPLHALSHPILAEV